MRVECESCREVVAAGFEIDGAVVRATCPVCRSVMTAEVEPADAPSDAPLCPKCGTPRRGEAAACASCGLDVARMAGYSAVRDAAVPVTVRDAWARTTLRWNEPAAHDELMQLVAAHNCYAWAAGRYRTRGPNAVAQRQLERLRRAAEATLLASATARADAPSRPYRATRGVLAILILAVVVGLVYATVIRDNPMRPIPARGPAIPAQPLTPGHPPIR